MNDDTADFARGLRQINNASPPAPQTPPLTDDQIKSECLKLLGKPINGLNDVWALYRVLDQKQENALHQLRLQIDKLKILVRQYGIETIQGRCYCKLCGGQWQARDPEQHRANCEAKL